MESATLAPMTKLFEQAIDAVRGLPAEAQDEIARAMLRLAADDEATEAIEPDHLRAIQQGLAEAGRGEFAPDDEIRAAFRRFDR